MSEEAAQVILALREGRSAGPLPPLTLDGAYATQRVVEQNLVDAQGWRKIGYKIGATTPALRQKLGLDEPFIGPLFDRLTLNQPAELAARPEFFRTYEAEYVIEIGQDLDDPNATYDAAAIQAVASAVLPGIELTGSVLPAGGPDGTPGLIADLAGHAHEILGARVQDFADYDFVNTPVTFSVNGEVKALGKGANVDGSPFATCAWLATRLARAGRPLRTGDLVTAGSTITPFPVAAGQKVVADFGALGSVALAIG